MFFNWNISYGEPVKSLNAYAVNPYSMFEYDPYALAYAFSINIKHNSSSPDLENIVFHFSSISN